MGVSATIITFTIAVLTAAIPLQSDPLMDALLLDFEQDGIIADRASRTEAYRAACEAGHVVACGSADWRSEGPIDIALARERLTESCQDNTPASCLAVGWMDTQRRLGAADPSRGAVAMQDACEAGLERACVDWAVQLIDTSANPTLGRKLLASGCESGESAACRVLGELDGDAWLLERGCLLGDARSCREAGVVLLSHEQSDKAWTMLEAACQRQEATGCLLLAARPDREADWPVALLTDGCAAYSAESCGRLGDLYAQGQGVVQDAALAGQFHAVACQEGFAPACEQTSEAESVADFHRLRCERGDASGCQTLGRSLMDEAPQRAQQTLSEGCGLGGQPACVDLGWLEFASENFETAEELWAEACESDTASGCAGLGWLMRNGGGRKSDLAGAADCDLKACALDVRECQTAAWLSLRGLGIERDVDQAVDWIRQGCEAGDQAACTDLGWRYSVGQGLPRDAAAAQTLWEAACEAGDSGACTALVFREARDAETLRDPCEGGDPASCAGLGIAYATGKGVSADLTYGMSLLEGACSAEPVCEWGSCEGDGAVACRWLGHMYTQGAGVKASRREAKQYYRRACDLGDLLSCG